MKIGQKIPVATGSYNAGVSTGVASIGVQTQFTYLDVGVNIDMTPTVHYDREVTLKMKIEVLSQASSVTISGVTEPIIGQRSSEQIITLKDGEPSLLAGIITKQDSLNINGTPGLGEIPLLKYFFTSRDKNQRQDEIVFLLIPHIVRESVLTRMNTRAIDTGTGQSIELRRDASASQDSERAPSTPTSSPAPRPAHNRRQRRLRHGPAAQPAGPATPLRPPDQARRLQQPQLRLLQHVPGGPAHQLHRRSAQLQPDRRQHLPGSRHARQRTRRLLRAPPDEVQPGRPPARQRRLRRLPQPRRPAASLVHREDNGLVAISTTRPPNAAGVSGQGSLCTLTFKAIAAGDSDLTLVKVGAHQQRAGQSSGRRFAGRGTCQVIVSSNPALSQRLPRT